MSAAVIYDPTSAEAHADPYPAYARLRDEHPLYYCVPSRVWALSRYADVRDGLRDWETFSSAHGVEVGDYIQFFGAGSIQELDPPRHDTLRKILAPRFQVRRMREYEPIVRECAEDAIADIRGRTTADLGLEFTRRIPVLTIFRLMGIPERDIRWTVQMSLDMLDRPAGESGPSERARAIRTELVDYILDQVERRRRDGGTDDVISDVAASIDEGRMDVAEVPGLMLLLVAAGMETTTSLMGSFVNALATAMVRPAQLIDATGRLTDAAIDEFVRWDSPAQWLSRVTTRRVTLHGVDLPAGSRVLMIFAAANRDPRAFERPDDLIFDRGDARSLAFGEGIHYCIGMPLAKLEARVGIGALIDGLPPFRSAGAPARYRSHVIRGLERIPVAFDG